MWTNGPGRLSSSNWKKLRAYVLQRDGHICYVCKEAGNQVDHLVPHYQGGSNHPSNLAVICLPCHKVKTSKEASHAHYGSVEISRKDKLHPMAKLRGVGGTP